MREEVLGKILEKLYESQPFGEKAISIQLFSIYYSDKLVNLNKKKIIEVSNLSENYLTEMSKRIKLVKYLNRNIKESLLNIKITEKIKKIEFYSLRKCTKLKMLKQEDILNLEKKQLLDEQSKIYIEQLYKTTLNISNQSFEVKKLCIITITAVITIIKKTNINDSTSSICLFGLIIALLFYTVDSFMYFYQRNLRKNMIIEENKIYFRNNISKKYRRLQLKKTTLVNSFFNMSHTLYYLLFFIFISIIIFDKILLIINFLRKIKL